jgi:hypothetical protein
MTRSEFKLKYGVPVLGREKSFYAIYVEDLRFKYSNPAKILKICKDLPFKWLKEDYPVEYRRIMHYIPMLEYAIHDLKTSNPIYYNLHVKPHIDG